MRLGGRRCSRTERVALGGDRGRRGAGKVGARGLRLRTLERAAHRLALHDDRGSRGPLDLAGLRLGCRLAGRRELVLDGGGRRGRVLAEPGRTDLAPRLELTHEVARAVGSVVVGSERHDTEGVEVVGDARHQVGGGHGRAVHQRGERQGVAARRLSRARVARPVPGQGGVEHPDQPHGIGPRGGPCVAADVTEQCRVERQPADEDATVGAHVHDRRAQGEMVDATAAGDLEGRGGLSDDRAGLVGGQRRAARQLGEGRSDDLLGDDVAVAVVQTDVQHAHEPGIGDEGRPARGVERGCHVSGLQDADPDGPVEDLVRGSPCAGALEVGVDGREHAVATREHGATADDLAHQHLHSTTTTTTCLTTWIGRTPAC